MPNLSEAVRQGKLLNSGFLDTIGIGKDDAPQLSTVEAMMALYAKEFFALAAKSLNEKGKTTTGELEKSFDFTLTSFNGAFKMELLVLDYYTFVDQGVQGLGPNNKNATSPYKFKFKGVSKSHAVALLKWVRANVNAGKLEEQVYDLSKLQTKRKKLVKAVSEATRIRSIAYAIGAANKRSGLERTGFWSDSFDKTFKDFAIQMSKALGVDVQVDLQQLVRGIKKKR